MEWENLQGQKPFKTINSWRLSAIAIKSWKHYHDSIIMAVTIMMYRYINVSLKLQTKYCKLAKYTCTSKLVVCHVNVLFNIRLVQYPHFKKKKKKKSGRKSPKCIQVSSPLSPCWMNYDAMAFNQITWSTPLIQIHILNDKQKPTDLDQLCLQRRGISRFSRANILT